MSKESTQKKLSRVRPPRVQITYDVELGDAIETKELPFVLGVLGDYSGHGSRDLPKLKERRFVQVDRDNFDEVLKGVGPRLEMRVANRLRDDDTQLGVELEFNALADFEPQNVVRQVEPLRRLLEARERLAELRNKMVANDRLEELLDDVLRDTAGLREMRPAATPHEEERE